MTADDIIHLQDVTSTSGGVTVSIQQEGLDTLTILGNSQTNLAALVVNNIAGKNQVANATNIAAGGGIFLPASGNLTIDAIDNIVGGSQVNNISQYRGTPAGVTVGPTKACAAAGAAVVGC
jgi:hypothetical protein